MEGYQYNTLHARMVIIRDQTNSASPSITLILKLGLRGDREATLVEPSNARSKGEIGDWRSQNMDHVKD